ncbi:hypothetical protein [Neobacillus sp. YIM B06451]|uniref:hypothetical protein n=1 Tax=Neobacillus sp. YIM B06451 TaxID=3070994 RepID=UPI00292F341B|nr:hypothetical protein [Neobacillus sp. YIM B06451]
MDIGHKKGKMEHEDFLEEVFNSISCKQTGHHEHHDECEDDCHCKDNKHCICLILCELENKKKTLRFRTKSGDEIIGTIKCFDKCTGCVVIIQPGMKSPKLPPVAVIISCRDIESISFEVDHW